MGQIKGIVFSLFIVMVSSISLADSQMTTVTNYSLNSNMLAINLNYKIPPAPFIKYISDKNMIYIDIPDTTLSSLALKQSINNSEYIKKMDALNGYENDVTIFIYLNPGVKYQYVLSGSSKQFQFTFTKVNIPNKKITIVLDPGHGGKDPGAVGIGGIQEKNVVYAIAMDLQKILLQDNFNVVMTRNTDKFVTLPGRSRIANTSSADFFISIHANAATSQTGIMKGVEAFYFSKTPSQYAQTIAAYENSVDKRFGVQDSYTDLIVNDIFYQINQDKAAQMAALLTQDIAAATGEQNRGIYGANFAVLRGSKMPSVLVEVGFVTNSIEARNLNSPVYQLEIASAIAQGVEKYYNL